MRSSILALAAALTLSSLALAGQPKKLALPLGHTATMSMPGPVSQVVVDDPSLVEVSRDGKVVARLPSGSHFGEMALLNQRPRSATVRAAGECRLLHLSREAFYSVVQRNPVVGVKFLWRLAQGNYKRGLATRIRRVKGEWTETEASDLVEYHVVRDGVDEQALETELRQHFADVEVFTYWSTQSPFFQKTLGWMELPSEFGLVARRRTA